MAKYRAGVIGDSRRTRPYGHDIHMAWNNIASVETVALADAESGAHEQRASECGARTTYSDHQDMLAKEDLDFVSICPHYYDLHERWLLDCTEAGVKGIYIEKPMTRTLAEADKVIAAAETAGTKIAVAHQWGRFHPGIVQVREWIADGRIGDLRTLRAHGKCDARGGAHDLFVLGTHLLDLMRTIAGDVAWATGHVQQGGREAHVDDVVEGPEGIGPLTGDDVTGYFVFRNGVTGSIESYVRDDSVVESTGIEIWGRDGAISVRSGGRDIAVYARPALKPTDPSTPWQPESSPVLGQDGTPLDGAYVMRRLNELAALDLIDACESGREPYSSAREATAALEMIMAVFEGERTRARVEFPMVTRDSPFAVWRAIGRR